MRMTTQDATASQPDFTSLFYDYFGSLSGPVGYTVRYESLFHDLCFLRSLVHDARFRWSDVLIQQSSLLINIERDRWEGMRTRRELDTVRSALTIEGVMGLRWHGIRRRDKSRIYEILYVYVDADYWDMRLDYYTVVLLGNAWSCTVRVESPVGSISVQDESSTPVHPEEMIRRVAYRQLLSLAPSDKTNCGKSD